MKDLFSEKVSKLNYFSSFFIFAEKHQKIKYSLISTSLDQMTLQQRIKNSKKLHHVFLSVWL